MALKIDTVTQTCRLITREIRDTYKNLTVHFIVHHAGQRSEALAIAAQELQIHPASETAMHILQKPRPNEDSAMIGVAVARQNMFFGLASRERLLALCTINLDQFESLKEARRHIYHMCWHAIDAMEYHGDPGNRGRGIDEIIVRRRSALDIAKANLEADVFSALISGLHEDKDAIGRVAIVRSANALSSYSLQYPEYYPFVIASEASRFAFNQLHASHLSKKKLIPSAVKLAREIGKTFDDGSVAHWLSFSEPAQDMAWRGYGKDEILSAAINTSQNTFVRSIGYLISEVTGIQPSPILKISESYSPYADDDYNIKLHERMVKECFEDVITQTLSQSSVQPLLRLANRQNEALTEGRITGWCASSLQAAAHAYEYAVAHGTEPESLVRREFEGERGKTSWGNLRELGEEVVQAKRAGGIVTMSRLAEISKNIEGIKSLQKSIEQTILDPGYQQKLDAVKEYGMGGPQMAAAPSAPAAAPRAPQAAATAAPRGPGGSNSNAHQQHQRIIEQARAKEGEGQSGDGATTH
jgi:hypothetical protein